MKNLQQLALLLLASTMIWSCSSGSKVELFNGKDLENWDIFVSKPEVEPGDLFWVEDGVISTSGVPHGYIRTQERYGNYQLHVEWRWTAEPTNSGVLLHVQGRDMIWPHCIECQLMHGHAGDLVLMGKDAGITVGDSTYLITSEENRYAVIPKFKEESENPPGEWNSYDIKSVDGEIEVVVNGVLQHTGTGMTLNEGRIALQSEGSPIQFRNIYLELLD
jgi:hypothetical protein